MTEEEYYEYLQEEEYRKDLQREEDRKEAEWQWLEDNKIWLEAGL